MYKKKTGYFRFQGNDRNTRRHEGWPQCGGSRDLGFHTKMSVFTKKQNITQ
jgi:hypothetical protein